MKNTIHEFKKFIARGSVIDLAVGIIIGGAFSTIVTSLVNNILTPILGLILGGVDFSNLAITFKDTRIEYGAFIESIINFLIIAFCLFILIKFINKISNLKKKEEIKEKPKKPEDVILLEEIRDLLKEEKQK
mgnify:FL=1